MSSDRQLSRLLQLMFDRRLFARLHRGPPTLENDRRTDWGGKVVWFVPDADSDATSALFTRVRGNDRQRWLLVSLSGQRRQQFLGGYAARHTYMTYQSGTTRFHSAREFYRRRGARGVCRGGEYHRREVGRGTERSRRAMEGAHLRVLYTDDEFASGSQRLQVLHRDGVITGGFVGSLILIMQDVLGFNYSLHPVYANGNISSWDHGIWLLHQGEGDLFGGRMMVTSSRYELVDFSFPLMTEIAGAAIDSRHTLTLTEFRVTQPLETAVWGALLATQLLAVLVLCLIARCQQRIRQTVEVPSDDADPSFWALMVLGVCCQQGAVVRSDSAASYRLAISALYLVSLFVLACYSGNLLAEMTLARRVMPFDNLQEALDNGWSFSDTGMNLAVREGIVQPLVGRDIDRLPMVPAGPLEGRNIQLASSTIAVSSNNCTELGRDEICPVCLWPGSLIRIPLSLAFRPNFPYLRLFNYFMPRLLNHGITNRELRHWSQRRTEEVLCPVGVVATLEKKPLTISNLKNVVAIVGFGVLGSGVVLICEGIISLLWDCYARRAGRAAKKGMLFEKK